MTRVRVTARSTGSPANRRPASTWPSSASVPALDAAAALEPALTLPAEQRISDITVRLADVRREFTAPSFHGSPPATALGESIETFTREAVTSGLHSLTG